MPKPRRRPSRRVADLPRLVVPLALGLLTALCAVGFIHFTRIVLDTQAHFAPGAEHPDDGYAVGCLFLGLLALAGIFLSLREPPPMRWRRSRRIVLFSLRRNLAKHRRRSGTIVPTSVPLTCRSNGAD